MSQRGPSLEDLIIFANVIQGAVAIEWFDPERFVLYRRDLKPNEWWVIKCGPWTGSVRPWKRKYKSFVRPLKRPIPPIRPVRKDAVKRKLEG